MFHGLLFEGSKWIFLHSKCHFMLVTTISVFCFPVNFSWIRPIPKDEEKRPCINAVISKGTYHTRLCAKRHVWNDQLITGIVRKTICVILTVDQSFTISGVLQLNYRMLEGDRPFNCHVLVTISLRTAAGMKCRNCSILVKKMVNFVLAKGMNWRNDAGIFADSSF